ncbi:MAG: hypothetical protein IKU04_01075 [Bacteroidales bacterium]|nr:hypothetical protein [Bacteroidales bacterium]
MDTITIRGREWAVEANWRAITGYLKSAGKDSLQDVSDVISLSPSVIGGLMAACINEGERIAGRDERVSPDLLDDLRATEAINVVNEFVRIYLAQSAPDLPEDKPKKEEAQ